MKQAFKHGDESRAISAPVECVVRLLSAIARGVAVVGQALQ
jgi:hypothetical protein